MNLIESANRYMEESVDVDILTDMKAFGLSKNDIDDDGYVTLYHGGKQLPSKLNVDEIFFMTANKDEATDYARMRKGKVFTIKVNPEDVHWNQGSYEIEYDKGGKIIDGVIIPPKEKTKDRYNKKEEFIDSDRKTVRSYKNVNVGDVLPKSNMTVYEIIQNVKTNNAQFNLGGNRWYDAQTVINYEYSKEV